MENVTKALLIAAGMFLAILIISSLVVLYNQISDFYAQEHEMAVTEQTQEFNSRFENYHGREIRGNEVISVINRIVDYNNRYADLQGYKRVEITIDLKEHAKELAYDDGDDKLFDDKIQNKSDDGDIKAIANLSTTLISTSGITGITDTKLQKLSSEIGNIVDASSKEYRNQKLKQILGYVPNESEIATIVKATKQYYQYTQFKRAMFKCTEITYDLDTKRVHTMKFEAVEDAKGKIVLE